MFIKVSSYHRGVSSAPTDLVLNVDHIVAFWGGSIRTDGVNETPVVYLDTTQIKGVIIQGSVDNLLSRINAQRGKDIDGEKMGPSSGECEFLTVAIEQTSGEEALYRNGQLVQERSSLLYFDFLQAAQGRAIYLTEFRCDWCGEPWPKTLAELKTKVSQQVNY
jgi:hypothetical protein